MRRTSLIRLFAFASVNLAVGWCASASAQEWPRFRGPNGSGIGNADGVPSQWTDADYNWKIELPGGGHSSPVVWGDRIFLTASEAKTGRRMLLCVHADDGKILWRRDFDLPATNLNGLNSLASSTPAVDGERVYVSWSSPAHYELMAFDHDGKDVWKHDLGPFASQHGAGTSPIVVNDLVVLSDDQDGPKSYLLALDRETGAVRWKVDRTSGSTVGSTPCVFQRPGEKAQVVFTARKHGFTGVDAASGKVLWTLPDLFTYRCVGSPVADAAADLVIGGCGEGANGKLVVAVRPGPAGKGGAGADVLPGSSGNPPPAQVVYSMTKQIPYVPTPLVKGDLLFVWSDIGTVTCMKVATGEVVWREKVPGAGGFYASPVCVRGAVPGGKGGSAAADRLYCVSREGDVVVLAASEKFEVLGRTPLGELCHATPALSGGRMYLRTFSHLMSLGGKK